VIFDVTFCDILWSLTITTKKKFNPFYFDNSVFLRKCPTGDIIPRSPFVSMKNISRLSKKTLKCGPPCEGRGKWIMDYGILPVRPVLTELYRL